MIIATRCTAGTATYAKTLALNCLYQPDVEDNVPKPSGFNITVSFLRMRRIPVSEHTCTGAVPALSRGVGFLKLWGLGRPNFQNDT